MRFSEKSFEVRFCAALSAAMMPFNRNPQWIGMTQAQERINGIDTMLRMGGRLHVFQFKAKQNELFKLEKLQWRCLDKIGRRYPRSTHYVFPEAGDVRAAAGLKCLLKHSWCVPAAKIGTAFRPGAETTTLSLDPSMRALTKKRPKTSIAGTTTCSEFGCFCPAAGAAIVYEHETNGGNLIYFFSGAASDAASTEVRYPPYSANRGIPLGDAPREATDGEPLRSSNEFEQMLGDDAEKDLAPGLFGLFLPSK
ncbi:hypothetical protein ACU8KI_03745 [Rhizobium leguminosarum]